MNETKTNDTPEMTLEECRAKMEEYLAGWKRAIADYQNREKEMTKEKDAFADFVREQLVLDFLSVFDNLHQAFAHVPEDQKRLGWAQGIGHILKQFDDTLQKHGVKSFSSLGSRFDPAKHEAVGDEDGSAEVVVREIAPGYESRGRILRPAKVVVGKGSPSTSSGNESILPSD